MGDYHTSTQCTRPKIKIDNNSILVFDDLDRQCTQYFFHRKQMLVYSKELYQFLSKTTNSLFSSEYCFTSLNPNFVMKELFYYKLLMEGFQLLAESFSYLAHTTMVLYQMKNSLKLHFLFNHFKSFIQNVMLKLEDIWVTHGKLFYQCLGLCQQQQQLISGSLLSSSEIGSSTQLPTLYNIHQNFPFLGGRALEQANLGATPADPTNPGAVTNPVNAINNGSTAWLRGPQTTDFIANQMTTDIFVLNEIKITVRDLKKRMKDFNITVQSEIILEKDSTANGSSTNTTSGFMKRGPLANNTRRNRTNNANNNNPLKSSNSSLALNTNGSQNHSSHYQEILKHISFLNDEEKETLMNTFFGNAFGSSSQVYSCDLEKFMMFFH
jgi:hypothetical protein